MTRGTRAARHNASSAAPCLPRSAALADLLRYCTMRAPPESALRTLSASTSTSDSSGVTAYSPRSSANQVTRRSGLARARSIHFSRPEEPVRYVLAHSRAKPGVERLPRVLLRFTHGLGQFQPVGERRRYRRGKRATGAVVGFREPFPAVGAHLALPAVESVDDLRCVLVRSRDEHVLAAQPKQLFRSARERDFFIVFPVALNEAPGLVAVRSEDGGLRQQ